MKIRDILTLDDNNKYLIASKAVYDNRTYYYLVDINNLQNTIFCYEKDDELVESKDKLINTKLLPLFLKESKNVINNID